MSPVRSYPKSSLLSRVLLLVLSSAPALPIEPAAAQEPDQKFEETSQVVAVEVPVNVVDRDGTPVRGLTAEDFEIFDAGSRQKITGFQVVDLAAGPSEAPAAGPKQEASLPTRRHFLLLFDLSFSTPTAILKARLAAREFLLESLHPSDLAAVATYSIEYGPKLVITFTPDRAQLARAIDTLGLEQSDGGRFRRDPLLFILEAPKGGQIAEFITEGSTKGVDLRAQRDQDMLDHMQAISNVAERDERTFEGSRVTTYAKALGAMARTLNAVPGRKHVVFFSEGFDSKLLMGRHDIGGEEAQDANNFRGSFWLSDNDERYGNTGLQNDLNRMVEEFRRADCVIQAVDIGGLRSSADVSGGRGRIGQEGLFYMANETGGELFKDTNNLGGQLRSLLERTNVTYLLTFERSDLQLNGSYHKLRVKAKLPQGARLSYRAGYYEPRPYKELDPLEKSLLASGGIMGAAPKKDLDLNLLVAPFRSNENLSYVPVIIEVPGRKLLKGHTGGKLKVEFYGYVNDNLGQMRDFFSEVVSLDISNGRQGLEQGGIKYWGHFDLTPGDYRVRVLVRNAETGRTEVTMVPVQVPIYSETEPTLLPPFFMEQKRNWVLWRESSEAGRPSVTYPFTVNGEPYVPSAKPVLEPDDLARLCLVGYNLGSGDLALDAQVTGSDGQVQPGGRLDLVERTATGIAGVDKLLATFQPTGLAAGDYVLRVAVTDPTTGSQEVNTLPFQVVAR